MVGFIVVGDYVKLDEDFVVMRFGFFLMVFSVVLFFIVVCGVE